MNKTTIQVRVFQESDGESAADLYYRVIRNDFHWMTPERLNQLSFEQDTRNEFILVAVLSDEVVGFISAWRPDHFIHHLYVDNDHRREGLGTHLLLELMANMESPLRLKCVATNHNALEFYKKRGFAIISTGTQDGEDFVLLELNNE